MRRRTPILTLLVSALALGSTPAMAADTLTVQLCASSAGLDQSLDTALDAYAQLDSALFVASTTQVRIGVACLGQPIRPDDAARVHLVHALDAWVSRDLDGMNAALRGLVATGPW